MKKNELEKIDEQIAKKKKIPKEVNDKINSVVFKNLIIAVAIMIIFIFILFGFINIERDVYITDLKVFSIFGITITLIIFEIAYKKDNGRLAINGIETLIISFSILSLPYILTYSIFNYTAYEVLIALLISAYYVSKSIIVLLREQKKYRNSLSDINEIIKKGNEIPEKYKNKVETIKEKVPELITTKETETHKTDEYEKINKAEDVSKKLETTRKKPKVQTKTPKTVKKEPKAISSETKKQKKAEKKVVLPKKTNTSKKHEIIEEKQKNNVGKEKNK